MSRNFRPTPFQRAAIRGLLSHDPLTNLRNAVLQFRLQLLPLWEIYEDLIGILTASKLTDLQITVVQTAIETIVKVEPTILSSPEDPIG